MKIKAVIGKIKKSLMLIKIKYDNGLILYIFGSINQEKIIKIYFDEDGHYVEVGALSDF